MKILWAISHQWATSCEKDKQAQLGYDRSWLILQAECSKCGTFRYLGWKIHLKVCWVVLKKYQNKFENAARWLSGRQLDRLIKIFFQMQGCIWKVSVIQWAKVQTKSSTCLKSIALMVPRRGSLKPFFFSEGGTWNHLTLYPLRSSKATWWRGNPKI